MSKELKPEMVTRCRGCEQDVYDLREYSYMVHDEEWAMLNITEPPMKGLLCIGCLQKWRGRGLCIFDFKWNTVLTNEDITLTGAFGKKTHQKSRRLLEVMLRLDPKEKIDIATINFEEVELRVLMATTQQAHNEAAAAKAPFFEYFCRNRDTLAEHARRCGMVRKHG